MRLFHPEIFQGSLKKKKYFEGWYFKTADEQDVFALIPGISLGADPHAFIQIIDGRNHESYYVRYPVSDFSFKKDRFEAEIGPNFFSASGCRLDIDAPGVRLEGELRFTGQTPFPSKILSPGIMGPYSFVPMMECYHGVVSADHSVNGKLLLNGIKKNIINGRGYIEKDWGRSMPSSWIWVQSNSFEKTGISFMLSIAKIPWLGKSFTGHLAFLYLNGGYHMFATYNGSSYSIDSGSSGLLRIKLENRNCNLEAAVPLPETGGDLRAPVNGEMQRTIRERTDTEVSLKFSDSSGSLIFEGRGRYCGIEATGNLTEL